MEAVAYVEHVETGTIPMPHIPGLPRIEAAGTMTTAPELGQHSSEILREWGYSEADIGNFMESTAVA